MREMFMYLWIDSLKSTTSTQQRLKQKKNVCTYVCMKFSLYWKIK